MTPLNSDRKSGILMSEFTRWFMSRDHGTQYVVSPDPAVDEVEVVPVSEHEELLGAARAEAERYRVALSAIAVYSEAPHRAIAAACGEDACTACLIHGTAKEALSEADEGRDA